MELVVRKADLLRELALLQGIVDRKVTIPVLGNVLVDAEGAELRLTATDMEVGLRSRCEASVAKPGHLTVPAKTLFEIVKNLPDTDVRIEQDRAGVRVSADRFDSRLQTLPADDYPSLPAGVDEYRDVIDGASLRHMIRKTQFAITAEDTRYFLNGALFVLRPGSMSLVATDGHRLALVTVPRNGGAASGAGEGEEVRVLLAKKTLGELERLLAEGESEVHFSHTENHQFFKIGPRLLISRTNEGQFPAYDRVIPRANDQRVDFERDRLAGAIRRVKLLSNERSRAVKLQFEPGQAEVTAATEIGDAREVLLVEYGGPSLQICFNAQYILDFLNVVETEQVVLEFKDAASQAVLRPVAAEGYDYLYVVMPMRV